MTNLENAVYPIPSCFTSLRVSSVSMCMHLAQESQERRRLQYAGLMLVQGCASSCGMNQALPYFWAE
eukprot:4680059-Amphidinium_carterae.1